MKRILILGLGLGLLAGCTDRLPTGADYDRTEVRLPVAEADAAAEARAGALDAIDDALDRIVPSLADATAAQPLEGALRGLRNALARADAQGNPALIEAARSAVERYARHGHDEADLDAIRLALDHAAQVFGAGC